MEAFGSRNGEAGGRSVEGGGVDGFCSFSLEEEDLSVSLIRFFSSSNCRNGDFGAEDIGDDEYEAEKEEVDEREDEAEAAGDGEEVNVEYAAKEEDDDEENGIHEDDEGRGESV
jgi:hypothetical protein